MCNLIDPAQWQYRSTLQSTWSPNKINVAQIMELHSPWQRREPWMGPWLGLFFSSRNPSFQLIDTGIPRTFFYVRAALLVTDRRWTLQPSNCSQSPYSGFVLGLMFRNQTLSPLSAGFHDPKKILAMRCCTGATQLCTQAPTGALYIAILPCHMIAWSHDVP